jgi:hypothetical protein
MVEVAGEFDFLVANLRNLGEGALEIGLHGIANGVELYAYSFDFVFGRKATV